MLSNGNMEPLGADYTYFRCYSQKVKQKITPKEFYGLNLFDYNPAIKHMPHKLCITSCHSLISLIEYFWKIDKTRDRRILIYLCLYFNNQSKASFWGRTETVKMENLHEAYKSSVLALIGTRYMYTMKKIRWN